MGWTLKVVDGQVEFDPATGLLNTVDGERKCAQDLAECLMQDFDPAQNYGSILNQVVNSPEQNITEMVIVNGVSTAIGLLQSKQQEDVASTESERISRILALNVSQNDQGDAAYYVRVETEDGGAGIDVTILKPTSLEHQFQTFD